ncbi:MAG: hypothetical protein A2381_02830 [Bdellovibrionales bacterium RIFOXYB1_FULL_37_110]|nr:MAG: hypothetical protein A2381_02830 [Bdellovibrionales bacterium RIFOXYB1_FULL_37_110]
MVLGVAIKIIFCWWFGLGCFWSSSGFAEVAYSGKILDISVSGQSVIIDRGKNHALVKNEQAIFYVYEKHNPIIKDYLMKEVARGRSIEVKDNSSYWYLHQIDDPKLLKNQKKIYFITSSQVLRGRVDTPTEHETIVLGKNQNVQSYQETSENGLAEKFARKKHEYRQDEQEIIIATDENPTIHSNYYSSWRNGNPQTVKELKQDVETKYFDTVTEERFKGEIEKKNEEDIFYSSAQASMNTFNEKQLYGEQSDDDEQRLNDASMQRLKEPDLRWSKDLTDEELRKFFIESGTFKERKRQKFALQNSIATEFVFKYGSSMVKHANENDLGQKELTKFWGVGIEYHLLRLSENFRKWTLDFYYEKAVGYYDVAELFSRENVKIVADEKYYKLGVNYYFYNYPSTLYRLLAHVGVRMGMGSAQAKYVEYGEMDSYAVTIFPQIHAGLKYRFKAQDEDQKNGIGFGLNTLLSYELLQFRMDEKKTDDSSGSFDVHDLKLSVGLGVFF